MFFKRRNWQPELVAELRGSYGGLAVCIRRFPCLADTSDGRRKFRYPDFGAEFLAALTDQLPGNANELRAALSGGEARTVLVQLRDLEPVEVQLAGQPPATSREFHSDLADAIISALKSAGVQP